MKEIIFTIGALLGFIGCASNSARLSHFPSSPQVDYRKMDSIQKTNEAPHRFFYNCNFENDYLIKIHTQAGNELEKRLSNALAKNGYYVKHANDSLVVAERGLTLWEWKTIAAIYFMPVKDTTYIYIRTEISQDITCGPNINRAKQIVKKICEQEKTCLEIREISRKTKAQLWPVGGLNGGLENENFAPIKAYPPE